MNNKLHHEGLPQEFVLATNKNTRANKSPRHISFARKTILGLLNRMNTGRLDIVLPEGERLCVGDKLAEVKATIYVHEEEFFERCLRYADIGLAESYIDGSCDISSIRAVIEWFLQNQANSPVLNESQAASKLINLLGFLNKITHFARHNSKKTSKKNIAEHYDLGNDFFSIFLDPSMTYSSAFFEEDGMSLEEAQLRKFHRIAAKLNIQAEDKVLEVGCGWGALSCYLVEQFSCSVTALTISQEQYQYCQKLIRERGLEGKVDLRLEDYRDHVGNYDKIVSIEMIEAVGDKYMDTFIKKLDSLLVSDGLLLMQMITSADSRYDLLRKNVDFIQKHIFPGSLLPSLYRVNTAMMKSGELYMVDLFDMTHSYVRTLEEWQRAFEQKIPEVKSQGFSDAFVRKWRYYFEYCQAAFAMRNISLVQAMYSRPNNLRLSNLQQAKR